MYAAEIRVLEVLSGKHTGLLTEAAVQLGVHSPQPLPSSPSVSVYSFGALAISKVSHYQSALIRHNAPVCGIVASTNTSWSLVMFGSQSMFVAFEDGPWGNTTVAATHL